MAGAPMRLLVLAALTIAAFATDARGAAVTNFYNTPDPFSTPTVSTTYTAFTPDGDADLQIDIMSATSSNYVRRFVSRYDINNSQYTADFDGTNDFGAYLPVGTYLAKAKMGLTATFNTVIQGTGAVMSNPEDMFVDTNGNVYIVNSGNDTLEIFNAAGQLLRKVTAVTGGGNPYGVAYATSTSMIYISYAVAGSNSGTKIGVYNSDGTASDTTYICQTGCNLAVTFSNIRGLGVDGPALYVADYGGDKAYAFNIFNNGTTPTTYSGWPAAGRAAADTYDIAVATNNNAKYAYATDNAGDKLTVINALSGAASTTIDVSAQCDAPYGISSNIATGTELFITCRGATANKNNRLVKYGTNNNPFYKYGIGSQGNGTSPSLEFYNPNGTGYTSGYVFISDTTNQRVVKVTDSGAAFTYTSKIEGDVNNIFGPTDMAIDGAKNIYVASNTGNFVKEFTKDGQYIRSVGGPGTGSGEFNGIRGIEVCDAGTDGHADYIYVADYGGSRIQCYSVSGGGWNSGAGGCGVNWGTLGLSTGTPDKPYGMGIDTRSNVTSTLWKLYYMVPDSAKAVRYIPIPNCVYDGSATGTIASWSIPIGVDVAVDSIGNVLATTGNSQQVRQKNPTLSVNLTTEGDATKRASYGITMDKFGNVYVSARDTGFAKVIKMGHYYDTPVTSAVLQSAYSFATYNASPSDTSDELAAPYGLAVDPDAEFIWVADESEDRLKKFILSYATTYDDNISICANATPTVTAVTLSDPSPTKAGVVRFTVNFDACAMNVSAAPTIWFKTANPYNATHFIYNEAVVVDTNLNGYYDSGEPVRIGTPPPVGTALTAFPANVKHSVAGAYTSGQIICLDSDLDNSCESSSDVLFASTTPTIPFTVNTTFAANEKFPDYDSDGLFDGYYVNNEWRGFAEIPTGEDGVATVYVCGPSTDYSGPITTGGKYMAACDNAWTFEIDTTPPTAVITEPQENVTTNSVIAVAGICETNCDVNVVMSDFTCIARDADGDGIVDTGENISGCTVGDSLTSMGPDEGFIGCSTGTQDFLYEAGEAIAYDNPSQGVVGAYDPSYDILIRCCGASSCAEAGFNNTCTAPCTAPVSGQDLVTFDANDSNVSILKKAYQDVETGESSDTFYANYISLPAPVPGFKYIAARGTDLAGNVGDWSTPRHRVKRENSDPGTASITPANEEMIGSRNTWDITYAAVAAFTGCSCSAATSTCYVKMTVPNGWTAPTTSTGSPGEISVTSGGGTNLCGTTPYSISGQTVTYWIASMSVGSTISTSYGTTANGGAGATIGDSASVGSNYFLMKSCNICGTNESDLANPNIIVHGKPMKIYHVEDLGTSGKIYDNTTDKAVMHIVFSNPDTYSRNYQVSGLELTMAASPTTIVPSDVVSKVTITDGSGNIVLMDSSIESTGNKIVLEGLSANPIAVNAGGQNSILISMDFKCLSTACTPNLAMTRLMFLADALVNYSTGTSTALAETSLTDSTKSWATNSLSGYFLIPKTSAPSKSYTITANKPTILYVQTTDTMVTDGATVGSAYSIGGPGTTFSIFESVSGTSVKINSDRNQTASDTFYPDWNTSQSAQMQSGAATLFSPPPTAKEVYITADINTWPYGAQQKVTKGQTSTQPFALKLRPRDTAISADCTPNCSSATVSSASMFTVTDQIIIGDNNTTISGNVCSDSTLCDHCDVRTISGIAGSVVSWSGGATTNGPYLAADGAYMVRCEASAKLTGLKITVAGNSGGTSPVPNAMVTRKVLSGYVDAPVSESSGTQISFNSYLNSSPIVIDNTSVPKTLDFKTDILCSGTPTGTNACPAGPNTATLTFSIPASTDFTFYSTTTTAVPSPWTTLSSYTATVQDQSWGTVTSVDRATPDSCPSQVDIGTPITVNVVVANAANEVASSFTRADARFYSSSSDIKIICAGGNCTTGNDYTSYFSITPVTPVSDGVTALTVAAGATGTMVYTVTQTGVVTGTYTITVASNTAVASNKPETRDRNDFSDSDKLYTARGTSPSSIPCGLKAVAVPAYFRIKALSPGDYPAATQNVPILKFQVDDGPDLPAGWNVSSVTVRSLNTSDSDVAYVHLWSDTNANGALDTSADTRVATATFSGGWATFSSLTGAAIRASSTKTFFVTYNIASTVTDGNTIDAYIPSFGLSLTDAATTTVYMLPSTDSNSSGTSTVDVVATQISVLPVTGDACTSNEKTVNIYAYDAYSNLDTDSTEYVTINLVGSINPGTQNETFTTTTSMLNPSYTASGTVAATGGTRYTTAKGNLVAGVGDVTFIAYQSENISLTPTSSLGASASTQYVRAAVCLSPRSVTNGGYAASTTVNVLKARLSNGTTDTLTISRIRMTNTGTAGGSQLSRVRLYKQPISGAETLLDTQTLSGSYIDFAPAGFTVAANATLDLIFYYDIGTTSITDNLTLNAKIPASGIEYSTPTVRYVDTTSDIDSTGNSYIDIAATVIKLLPARSKANLTSDCTSCTTINATSTSYFSVGDIITIGDNNGSATSAVTAINSSTQLTISPAASGTYTTGNAGYISNVTSNTKALKITAEDTYGNTAKQNPEGNTDVFSVSSPSGCTISATTYVLPPSCSSGSNPFVAGSNSAAGCLTTGFATNTFNYFGCAPQSFTITPNSTVPSYTSKQTAIVDFPGDLTLDSLPPTPVSISITDSNPNPPGYTTDTTPPISNIQATDDCGGVWKMRLSCDPALLLTNESYVPQPVYTTQPYGWVSFDSQINNATATFTFDVTDSTNGCTPTQPVSGEYEGLIKLYIQFKDRAGHLSDAVGVASATYTNTYMDSTVIDTAKPRFSSLYITSGQEANFYGTSDGVSCTSFASNPVCTVYYASGYGTQTMTVTANIDEGFPSGLYSGSAFASSPTDVHSCASTPCATTEPYVLTYTINNAYNTAHTGVTLDMKDINLNTKTIYLDFRPDNTAPDNPAVSGYDAQATTTTLTSGNWYRYPSPFFSWSSATDLPATYNSGFKQFDLYWGVASTGSVAFSTTVYEYGSTATLTSGYSYYLRMSGKDNVGNSTTTTTVFTYNFDSTPPNNPTVTGYDTSAMATTLASGTWYNYTAPYFSWSGATDLPVWPGNAGFAQYVLYWATDPAGTPDYATSASALTSTSTLVSGYTYYLRMSSTDNAGNATSASTVASYKFDSDAPNNPTVTAYNNIGMATSLTDGNWYSHANPHFTWAAVSDLPAAPASSGVAQYVIYWGTSSTGTPSYGTTSLNFTSTDTLTSGYTYYLRMATRDNAGNATSATTLYTYKYDSTPPDNPSVSSYDTSAMGTALASGTWYNYTAPYFSWAGATDLPASPANSGFAQYVLYWGADPAGTPNYATTATALESTATLVSGYTYYLRMSSTDNAGNATSASTVASYKFDSSAPNNPTVTAYNNIGLATSLTDGNWYNYDNPHFTWAAVTDLPAAPASSGIAQYVIYWGTSSTGTPSYGTTSLNFTSTDTLVTGYTYYLRMLTRDNAGNATSATTLYTYKYDSTPPDNPSISSYDTSAMGTALASGTWYNYTAPYFSWSGATDLPASPANSGFAQYVLYWGTDPAGTPNYATTATALTSTATLVSGYTYYLRMSSTDNAGNATSASTVASYKFDSTAPNNPTVTAYNNIGLATSLTDGNWYNYDNPHFSWAGATDLPASPANSGFAQYVLYWGTDPAGTPNYATTATALESTATLVSGYTYYLRMSSTDNAGNATSASTVASYKFDSTAPNNPTVTAYNNIGLATSLTDGNWYNYANPHFTWAAVTDLPAAPASSGIAQYVIYWGTSSTGTPSYGTTSINFTSTDTLVTGYTYYLRMLTRDNAGNATSATTLYTYKYDSTPPDNPAVTSYDTSAMGTALASGTWYNYTAPHFSWAGATDLPAAPANSGFAQYVLYWGTDPAGTPDYATTATALTSTATLVSGYTYYLRMSGTDNAGNATSASTVASYKFDSTAPNNPTVTAYNNIGLATSLTDGNWYNYANPHFTWAAVSDLPAAPASSGIAQYVIYWGTSSTGTPSYGTTSLNFTSTDTLVTGYTYYLRMLTTDNAGNATSATTLYTYKYDSTPPDNPAVSPFDTSAMGTALASGTWYSYTNPHFSWAGATDLPVAPANAGFSQFVLYWGTDSAGTPDYATTATSLTSTTTLVAGYTYYLRMSCTDNAGNATSATTVASYKYDPTPPNNPTVTAYNNFGMGASLTDGNWYYHANPHFTWAAVSDLPAAPASSGVAQYVIYWGTDSAGTPSYGTTSINFTSTDTLVTGYTYYLRMLTTDNAGNATGTTTLYTYKYDPTPPDNPAVTSYDTSAMGSALASGTWYNYTAPHFSWAGATDLPAAPANSGFAQYVLYWGTDSAGTPSYATTGTALTSTTTLVTGYTYYLRMSSTDNAGNATSATTVATYKFDSTPPNVPAAINVYESEAQALGLVSATSYNYTNPYFLWSASSDLPAAPASSGTRNYWYSFSTDPNSVPDHSTSGLSYTCTDPLDTGIKYYFRMYVDDNANNSTSTVTMFEYRYDASPPDNPTQTVAFDSSLKAVSLTDGEWYNYPVPYFEWNQVADLPAPPKPRSGFYQYDVLFSTSNTATPTYATTTLTMSATQALVTNNIYYLRIISEDNAGNATSPSTTWTYKYDATVPTLTYNSPSAGGNTSWYSADPGGVIDIDLGWVAGSPIENLNYRIGAGAWASAWTGSQSSDYTTNWGITWASLAEGENQISVAGNDRAGNGATHAYAAAVSGFKYRKDASAPDNPAAPASAWASDSKLTVLTDLGEYDYANPYFEWNTPNDNPAAPNAGLAYYYVGFSTNPDFDPTATQTANYFYATPTLCSATYTLVVKTADNAVPANVAATTTKLFTTKFGGSLRALDYQAGDDTWHNSDPGATFNVDFRSPACASLDYAQYAVYTGAGMTGTQVINWTTIFGPAYGAQDYTSNWGVSWASLAEGVNYVSVRVYDSTAAETYATDIYYIKKDTIAPTISTGALTESNNYFWISPADAKLYYGNSMAAAQTFTVSGTATDTTTGIQASGLATATFSTAFDDTPSDDTSPATWSANYDITSTQTTATSVLVTVFDAAGNYATATYTTVYDNALRVTYATISKTWRPSYMVFRVFYPDGVTELTATGATALQSSWIKYYSVGNADVTTSFTTNEFEYNDATCEQYDATNKWCAIFIATECTPPADDMHHASLSGSSTYGGFIAVLAEEKTTAGDLADGTFQATPGPDYVLVKPEGDGLITADTAIPAAAWCSGAGSPCFCTGNYCTATSTLITSKPEYLKYNNGGGTDTILTFNSQGASPAAPGNMEWSYDTDDARIILFNNPSGITMTYTPASGSELVCAYLKDACDNTISDGKWKDVPLVLSMDSTFAPNSNPDFTESNANASQGFSSFFAGLPADTTFKTNGQTTVKGYLVNGKACLTVTAKSVPSDSPQSPIKIDGTYIDEDTLATGTLGLVGGQSAPGMILIRPSAGVSSNLATGTIPAVASVTTIFNATSTDRNNSITLNPAWNFTGDKLAFISRQTNPCAGTAASGDGPYDNFNIFTMQYSGGSWTNCVRVTRNVTDGANSYGPMPYSEVAWSPAETHLIFSANDAGTGGYDKLYWISATSSAGAATASQYNFVPYDPGMISDNLASNAAAGATTLTLSTDVSGFATGEQIIIGELDQTTNTLTKYEINTITGINTGATQLTVSTPLTQLYRATNGNSLGYVQYPVTLGHLGQTISPMSDNSTWYDPTWSPKDAAVGCTFPPDPSAGKFGDSLMAVRWPGQAAEDETGDPGAGYVSAGGVAKPNIVMFYGSKEATGVYKYGTSSIAKITNFNGTVHPLKPKWSPDCSKIAFVAWDHTAPLSPVKTSVYIINLTDTTAGWSTATLPVSSLTATGVYQVYSYSTGIGGTPNMPAYFPNWSADGTIVSFSVDTTNTFSLQNIGTTNDDFVNSLYASVDFDSYLEYIEDQPSALGGVLSPQLVGRELGGAGERNEFGMAQCPGLLTGSQCPGTAGNPVYTYITQNTSNSGTLRALTLSNTSSVTSGGGLLFLDGIVTAVFPPGVISSDTVFYNDWPTQYCTGAAPSETVGGGAGNCPVEPTGEFIVQSGEAREFFPDGTNFTGYARLIFHYCDNDDDGHIDSGTEGTQSAGFTYNSLTGMCQIGGVNTSTGTIDVDSIAVYNWVDADAKWVRMQGTIDKTSKTITVYSTHFSRYDTFGFRTGGQIPAFTPLQLSNIHTYPNPWRTGDGQLKFAADTAAGDGAIMVNIKIYDIRGSFVSEINNVVNKAGAAYPTDPAAGVVGNPVVIAAWDATNRTGRPLASGVYLYYLDATDLTNGTKVTTTGKLSIIH